MALAETPVRSASSWIRIASLTVERRLIAEYTFQLLECQEGISVSWRSARGSPHAPRIRGRDPRVPRPELGRGFLQATPGSGAGRRLGSVNREDRVALEPRTCLDAHPPVQLRRHADVGDVQIAHVRLSRQLQ